MSDRDPILYPPEQDKTGYKIKQKLKSNAASIAGGAIILGAVAAPFGLAYLGGSTATGGTPTTVDTPTYSCDDPRIKGNISMSTGEKIYHMPDDRFYNSTVIDESAGEKWFCTTAEAEFAGWRRTEK